MAAKRRTSTKMKNEAALRASVTFPPDLYRVLEQLAKEKKVSLAWVVRDAAENYVAEKNKKGGKGDARGGG
jgi:metal-responsive CopG/Arc/MetJ family transcriptional regulator